MGPLKNIFSATNGTNSFYLPRAVNWISKLDHNQMFVPKSDYVEKSGFPLFKRMMWFNSRVSQNKGRPPIRCRKTAGLREHKQFFIFIRLDCSVQIQVQEENTNGLGEPVIPYLFLSQPSIGFPLPNFFFLSVFLLAFMLPNMVRPSHSSCSLISFSHQTQICPICLFLRVHPGRGQLAI